MPHHAGPRQGYQVWSGRCRSRGRPRPEYLLEFLWGEARQRPGRGNGLDWASSNDSGRLEATGPGSSCQVPGAGIAQSRENTDLVVS